ncbi:MAG: hypothetical protein KME25_06515 [Symplocastrum torsivum CPER-KK1]|jgi:hypothetical protein|uniref:Uncharacterized protein n=1 Tax=Symplocastrum torsivum CPER-KK1 TaxID=450513 RepID=A0A951U8R9_9CYAN|nr:hypothetical protein [Symplocastrum torsivum CPER-KK1]
MDIEKRLMEYYKRWNIEFPYEEQFLIFKNRIILVVDKSIGDYLANHKKIDEKFLYIYNLHQADEPIVKKSRSVPISSIGSPQKSPSTIPLPGRWFGDTHLYREIKKSNTPQELRFILQAFFWALEEDEGGKGSIPELLKGVRSLSEMTPSVSFNIVNRGGEIIIYPHGEEILDKEVVNYVISKLEKYPNAAKQFLQALNIYQSGDTAQFRNLLDNLRLALEQLCKEVLHNNKSLENQEKALKDWFKQKKLHPNINTLYSVQLQNYTKYQNDAVKHDEKYSVDEVEFMIYLTATFMRLVIQLANEDLTEVDSQDVV